jgi:hypothetical protein
MTDVTITDDGDIVEEDLEIKRTPTGQFRKGVSGNPLGRRPKSTNKLNKSKLTASLNKHGVSSIEAIIRLAKKAEKDGQLPTAMKGYSFIAEKYLSAVLQQEKTSLALKQLRIKQEAEDDNDEDSQDFQNAIFKLESFKTGTDE